MAVTAEAARIPEWTLAERMQKARETANKSRDEMAIGVGRSVKTVIAWETGARNPGHALDTLRRWADLCNVSYAWLLTGSVHPSLYVDKLGARHPSAAVKLKVKPRTVKAA